MIWGLLGQGIGALDLGLTTVKVRIANKLCTQTRIFDRKFVQIKNQKPNNPLTRILTAEEKLDFVGTLASWISSKDIMDTCFILNFGYEAPLPWPQVSMQVGVCCARRRDAK